MGLYNEVNFICPDCGAVITEQTKSGGCSMQSFPAQAVPIEEVRGLDFDVFCDGCESTFNVMVMQPRVALALVPRMGL